MGLTWFSSLTFTQSTQLVFPLSVSSTSSYFLHLQPTNQNRHFSVRALLTTSQHHHVLAESIISAAYFTLPLTFPSHEGNSLQFLQLTHRKMPPNTTATQKKLLKTRDHTAHCSNALKHKACFPTNYRPGPNPIVLVKAKLPFDFRDPKSFTGNSAWLKGSGQESYEATLMCTELSTPNEFDGSWGPSGLTVIRP